jgi:uncharacterized protein YjbI with pentapeptide repeats
MKEDSGRMAILDYTIEELRKLKLRLDVTPDLAAIEARFHIKFPIDAHAIAPISGTGFINDYEQFDSTRAIEETERLRAAGGAKSRIVIGKLEGHLVAYEFGLPRPLIQAIETDELAAFDYTGLILEQIERIRYRDVRAALEKEHPDLTARQVQQWRHRWNREELAAIDTELERGKQIPHGLPIDEGDDASRMPLRDLRGIVRQVKPYSPQDEPRTTFARFDRTDFSFCEWVFDRIDARDCVFRGATMGCFDSRFERCDFTMIDNAAAHRDILIGEFIDCDFTGARMPECSMYGRFVRCNFTAANLWQAQPHDSTFTDCTFAENRFGGDARHWDEMRKPW